MRRIIMPLPIHLAVNRHPLAIYFALAFLISWAAVLWVVAPTGVVGTATDYAARGPSVFVAMLAGPSVAGLALTALFDGRRDLRDLWAHERMWHVGRWWTAVLITPAIVAVLGLLSIWWPELTPALVSSADKGGLIALALAIGLLAGWLEELGWTGFALPRMQDRWGWTRAGLVLGLIWGLWHLLADFWGNADAWGPLYVTRYVLWCGAAFTAYRMLIAWAYHHTGSLLLAQLMHAGFTGGQVLLAPTLTPSSSGLVWYAAFAVSICLITGCVIVFGSRTWTCICRCSPVCHSLTPPRSGRWTRTVSRY
jgi:membrane protease YdiL (CAAX protease family)